MAKLKQDALGPLELLAQNIALISPTMTAALIVPFMYATTGNWSWLSYALGTLMLLFVSFNLNQFASRFAGSGSMYDYIRIGLGNLLGGLGGWTLIWCYTGISVAGIAGFTTFAKALLLMLGIKCPAIPLFVCCIGMSGFCAWKDVTLSAKVMLIIEGASMVLITLLCLVALGFNGLSVDKIQFQPSTFSIGNLGLGVVVAVFSLVGFESATAFGEEARNPLKSVPWAVIVSLITAGLFFVFVTYVEVLTTHGNNPALDQLTTPLNTIADLVQMQWLGAPLSACAMVSFFALNLSCLNAGARIIYIMGQQGLFHRLTGASHNVNKTPHIAVFVMSIFSLTLPTACVIAGVAVGDIFNDAGTLAAFGFIVAYIMIAIAAPLFVKVEGELKPLHVFVATASLILLMIPTIGSIYPVPHGPLKYLPYMFAAYFTSGGFWIAFRNHQLVTAGRGLLGTA